MSLFGREPRPVYRVYTEDEYDGQSESFGGEARTEARPHHPPVTAGSLELRRRPVVFLVVGPLVLVAMVVVILVVSNASRRVPRRSASAAPAITTAITSHSRVATAPPMSMSTPARRNPARVSSRARRPSAAARPRTGANAPASTVVPIAAADARQLPESPPASVAAEFGFEP